LSWTGRKKKGSRGGREYVLDRSYTDQTSVRHVGVGDALEGDLEKRLYRPQRFPDAPEESAWSYLSP
jgi:hypothetical protein